MRWVDLGVVCETATGTAKKLNPSDTAHIARFILDLRTWNERQYANISGIVPRSRDDGSCEIRTNIPTREPGVRKLSSMGLFLWLERRLAFFAGQETVRQHRVCFVVAPALTECLHQRSHQG